MKIFFDNQILRSIKNDMHGDGVKAIAAGARLKGILTPGKPLEVDLGWASLLELLNSGLLFESFPKFDKNNPLFNIILEVLEKSLEKDLVIRLYDQVFVECLTQAKGLPEINTSFLLQQIEKRLGEQYHAEDEISYTRSLEERKEYLIQHPKEAMHDLILYLGFDRVCVYLAEIFEQNFQDERAQIGLEILKECLLESFHHIFSQKRTVPGFFRLCETLYAYQMREQLLQNYPEDEWLLLCRSSKALKPRVELSDLFNIEAALKNIAESDSLEPIYYFTLDSKEVVHSRIALAEYMTEKMKQLDSNLDYCLANVEVIYISANLRDAGFGVL